VPGERDGDLQATGRAWFDGQVGAVGGGDGDGGDDRQAQARI
jgi:hypothetical protein